MPQSSKPLDDFWDATIRLAASSDMVDDPFTFLRDVYQTCADSIKDGTWCRRQDHVFDFISEGLVIRNDRYNPGGDPRSKEGLLDACLTQLWIANNKIRKKEKAKRQEARQASPDTPNSAEPSREPRAERRHPLVHGPSSGRKVTFSSDEEPDGDTSGDDDTTQPSKIPRRDALSQGPTGGADTSQGSTAPNNASRYEQCEPRVHRAESPRPSPPASQTYRAAEPSRPDSQRPEAPRARPMDEPRGSERAESSGSQRREEDSPFMFGNSSSVYRKWEGWEEESLDRGIRKYQNTRRRWKLMLDDPELRFAPFRTEENLRDKFKRLRNKGIYG